MQILKPVGFDQKIKIQNLNLLVNKLRIDDGEDLYSYLDNQLMTEIKGKMSRQHVITMLMKIWNFSDETIESLKYCLVQEFPYLTKEEQICTHYCMSCIAYPFFAKYMLLLYKNLKLADSVQSKLLTKEMKNIYGDRRRVEVAASAVLSSVKDWGIVRKFKVGAYELPSNQFLISNPLIKYLLIETYMIINESDIVSLEVVNNSAIFYPFDFDVSIGDIQHSRLTVIKNIRDTLIERNSKIPYSL